MRSRPTLDALNHMGQRLLVDSLDRLPLLRKARAQVNLRYSQSLKELHAQQPRLDKLLDSARRHTEAQPVLLQQPMQQALDWADQLQDRVEQQLSVSPVGPQNPWLGSVNKRLTGLSNSYQPTVYTSPAARHLPRPRTLYTQWQDYRETLGRQLSQSMGLMPRTAE